MDNTLLPELKSCPFCGVKPHIECVETNSYRVKHRKNCFLEYPDLKIYDWEIKSWNRRLAK